MSNEYKFTRCCCGEDHDIRWDDECRVCNKSFLEDFGKARIKLDEKFKSFFKF